MSLKNILLFRRKYFLIKCPENFHYINVELGQVDGVDTFKAGSNSEYIEYLNSLNHCTLFIDEAWRVMDSYARATDVSIPVRNLILVTRHKYRRVNLIAQRTQSIQVTARANMNRFYKFEKIVSWPFVRFRRSEYQDMVAENVDETQKPVSVKTYFARKSIFNRYNSYYYGSLEPVHKPQFVVFHLGFIQRFIAFGKMLGGSFRRLSLKRKPTEKNFSVPSMYVQKLKKLVEEKGTVNPPTTVSGQLEVQGKKLENLSKKIDEEFVAGKKKKTAGEILEEYFSSYKSMKEVEDQALVRAVAREIMYQDLKAGKLKVPKEVEDIIRGIGPANKDVLDEFNQWYGFSAIEDLHDNAERFYRMASPKEAVDFFKTK